MKIVQRKILTLGQKQEIFDLWNNEYPKSLQYNDISEMDEYLRKLTNPNHFLLLDDNDKIKGWYSDFLRDREKWFLVILSSENQGQKFGSQIIKLSQLINDELNGWIINSDNYKRSNGQFYKSPTEFYRKQGFEILENTKLETDQISAIKIKWIKTGYNSG